MWTIERHEGVVRVTLESWRDADADRFTHSVHRAVGHRERAGELVVTLRDETPSLRLECTLSGIATLMHGLGIPFRVEEEPFAVGVA
jgi:hypothetical protein